jgi:CRP-like cAMP-binding protein
MLVVFFSGFLNAPAAIGRSLVTQRNTPREMRGRVNSVFFVARDVLFLIGMSAAALADVFDIRTLYAIGGFMILFGGVAVLFMPGLRQDREAWKQSLALLRGAPAAPGLGVGRAANVSDTDLLVGLIPTLTSLTPAERETLASHARVVDVPPGTTIVCKGDASDAAYFVLDGRAIAGVQAADGDYRALNPLLPGDFFGEIAALTGAIRTADVVAEEPMSVMQVPAGTLRALMINPAFSKLVLETMTERLNMVATVELPRFAGFNQDDLRDIRTNEPGLEG